MGWHRAGGCARRGGLAAAIALALALLACGGERESRGRVLLVGIDGATLEVAAPLLAAGRLPHLASLSRDGVHGRIQADLPLSSPRIWTSIATGVVPTRHGVLSFAREGPGGEQILYQSSDRRVPALWNIASAADLTVGVVNWWATYPLEKVRGVLVSDHVLGQEVEGRLKLTGARGSAGAIVYPPEWEERVARILDRDDRATAVENPFRARDLLPAWSKPEELSQRFDNDDAVTRIAIEVERGLRPDLLMVYLPGIDRVSHWLWGALGPAPEGARSRFSEAERVAAAAALRAYYEYTDALIGVLLEPYGPDDLVIVVSDHGFERAEDAGLLTGTHESRAARHGLIFARGPLIGRPTATLGGVSVNDVTPTILAWLGLPVARDMDGRPAIFLEGPPPAAIASYGDTPVERFAETPSGAEGVLLERLRSLGYLEPDGAGEREP